jgi:starch synthase (maltosyl-transferring)
MNRRKVIRIEASSPTIDCGAYPVKRIVGDELTVTADIFPDSQNALRAHVRWCDGRMPTLAWQVLPMTHNDNDHWQASCS